MANSSIIEEVKNKIVKEFIKDNTILEAINSKIPEVKKPEDYINTHIFDYNQNPYTINKVITFITVQVHIPRTFDGNKVFVTPTVEIWIVSHWQNMKVDNVPKVKANRNDYLSELIDVKLNGRSDFGIGKLMLTSNIEAAYQSDYLFRKMIFETTDINNSLCSDEE